MMAGRVGVLLIWVAALQLGEVQGYQVAQVYEYQDGLLVPSSFDASEVKHGSRTLLQVQPVPPQGKGGTVTSSQNVFSRMGTSLIAFVFGIIGFILAPCFICMSERKAVTLQQAVAEGRKSVVSVMSDKPDPSNNGKLVHMQASLEADGPLKDSKIGISVDKKEHVKLVYEVEMYQWVETSQERTEKNLGGGTTTTKTYYHNKTWSSATPTKRWEDFSFSGQNPDKKCESGEVVSSAKLGAGFKLTSDQIDKKLDSKLEDYVADDKMVESMSSVFGAKGEKVSNGSAIYFGKGSFSSPEVGDHKVALRAVPNGDATIVAQQDGASFRQWEAKSGEAIFYLRPGGLSADGMFDAEVADNDQMLLFKRFGGWLLWVVSIILILQPAQVIADIIPFFGNFVGAIAFIAALLIGTALTVLTMAIAWIFVRPMLAIPLLALALTLIFASSLFTRQGKGFMISLLSSAQSALESSMGAEGSVSYLQSKLDTLTDQAQDIKQKTL